MRNLLDALDIAVSALQLDHEGVAEELIWLITLGWGVAGGHYGIPAYDP